LSLDFLKLFSAAHFQPLRIAHQNPRQNTRKKLSLQRALADMWIADITTLLLQLKVQQKVSCPAHNSSTTGLFGVH